MLTTRPGKRPTFEKEIALPGFCRFPDPNDSRMACTLPAGHDGPHDWEGRTESEVSRLCETCKHPMVLHDDGRCRVVTALGPKARMLLLANAPDTAMVGVVCGCAQHRGGR